ncbi:hypothetical protein CEXT_444241 [Caerostris extrusa]|uniref:Uncharacterized protein n=1 Tax=Caerostris extrusa TaxID=172846 RepID=A0AAV4U0Z4_CAEEX|nr:hypothetical protein CEXT_444241 [Caerostris extrusa]
MSNPDLARFLLSVPLQLLFSKNSKRFERRGPLALNNTLLCHTLINSDDKHDSTWDITRQHWSFDLLLKTQVLIWDSIFVR